MKVQLLVSEWCVPCRAAEEVWRSVAREKAIAFEVLDVGQPEGRALVAKLGVRTVPSTVIDGELKHLGVPTLKEAGLLTAAVPARAATGARYVGMSLEATSAWAVVSSVAYLAAAGAALVFANGIDGDAPWRAAALHVFGLGFGVFLVFGLGEHLLPRFTGAPVRGGASAWAEHALMHAGTLLLAAGFASDIRALALAGGVAAWLAFALFAVRLAPVLAAPTNQ